MSASRLRRPGGSRLDRLIGNTPLHRLRRLSLEEGTAAEVWAKLESLNPGGSVKDRAARAIVRRAEEEGALDADRVLLDASSGNTGIAYAMLCAERGYRCEICMPANCSEERRRLLAAYGARTITTDPTLGSDGAIEEAERRAAAAPDRYFYANQYGNPANVRAHYETTAPEIWEQAEGRVTHFVASVGTGGTFVGTGLRLRALRPGVRLIEVQPREGFHGIEGVKHLGTARVPSIYRPDLADERVEVGTEEAQETARRLAREEGILSGVSAGANVLAALRVALEAGPEAVVVTVIPDGGERYLTERWMSPGPPEGEVER